MRGNRARCFAGLLVATRMGLGFPAGAEETGASRTDLHIPSFEGASAVEILSYFDGKRYRDSFDPPEEAEPSGIPDGFWDLPPREAALALANRNRTPTHRREWELRLDEEVKPPESGWISYRWDSASCYSYQNEVVAIRFGVDSCCLISTVYSAHGVVDRNPLADIPGMALRLVPLEREEADALAETIHWLHRLRASSPEDPLGASPEFLGMSSADGSGQVALYPDTEPPGMIASETVWAIHSISGHWKGPATEVVSLNLTDHLLRVALPQWIADRGSEPVPEVEVRNLVTPLEQRLQPHHRGEVLIRLEEACREILEWNLNDPVPPRVLEAVAGLAGEEGLVGLRPQLEQLKAMVPPLDAEDAEFSALERRLFSREAHEENLADPFGIDDEGEDKAEKREQVARDWERYRELSDARDLQFAAIVRGPLDYAMGQLNLLESPEDLLKAADEEGPWSVWALNQLRATDPERYGSLLIDRFHREGAAVEAKRMIFSTLAAAHPPGALRLRDEVDPEEADALLVEIAGLEKGQDAERFRERIPKLLDYVESRERDLFRTGRVLALLVDSPDRSEEQTGKLRQLLVGEIEDPRVSEFEIGIRGELIPLLSRLPDPERHVDLVASIRAEGGANTSDFDAAVAYLHEHVSDETERQARIIELVGPTLQEHPGMMNDVFASVLAFDLRSLRPRIVALATSSPDLAEGPGADFSGGGFEGPQGERYHFAREVLALWSEDDDAARARLWMALYLSRPWNFHEARGYREAVLRERLAEELSAHDPDVLAAWITEFRAAKPPGSDALVQGCYEQLDALAQ